MAGNVGSMCLLATILAVCVVGTWGYGEVHENLLGGIYNKKAALVGHAYPDHLLSHHYSGEKEEPKKVEKKKEKVVYVAEPIKLKSVELEPDFEAYLIKVKDEEEKEEEKKEYYPPEHYAVHPVAKVLKPKTSLLKGLVSKALGVLHH